MNIDPATPATQNGHDNSIRHRPSHDSNLQQAQTFFLLKYVLPNPPRREKPEKIHEHVSKRAVWIEGVKFSQLSCDAIAISTLEIRGEKTTTWVVQDTAAAERRKWPLGTQNGSGFGLDVTVCQLKWRLNMLNRDLEIQTWSQSNYHCCWVASPSSTDLAVA